MLAIRYFLSLYAAMSLVAVSCNPGGTTYSRNRQDSLRAAAHQNEEPGLQDSLYLKAGEDSTLRVVAGSHIGLLRLKVLSDELRAILGQPDSVGAGMCKDMALWYSGTTGKQSGEIKVYSVCDNDLNMRKAVKAIRLAGYPFLAQAGISEKSTYAGVKNAFPGALTLGRYTAGEENRFLLGDTAKGIVFEFTDTLATGRCRAVAIYTPSEPILRTTIPFYPGFEAQE